MTVTDLRQRRADTESALTGLAERLEEAVAGSVALISLEAARATANEAGVHRFQEMLLDALDQAEQARRRKRDAAIEMDGPKDAYATALTEAAWELESHFVGRSNKMWLARSIDGAPIAEDDQKSYDAKARKDWIEHHADKHPAVVAAKRALDAAAERVAQANDDIATAERAAKAAEHLLDSATKELDVLALALRHPTGRA
jgi:hypothetical protein